MKTHKCTCIWLNIFIHHSFMPPFALFPQPPKTYSTEHAVKKGTYWLAHSSLSKNPLQPTTTGMYTICFSLFPVGPVSQWSDSSSFHMGNLSSDRDYKIHFNRLLAPLSRASYCTQNVIYCTVPPHQRKTRGCNIKERQRLPSCSY